MKDKVIASARALKNRITNAKADFNRETAIGYLVKKTKLDAQDLGLLPDGMLIKGVENLRSKNKTLRICGAVIAISTMNAAFSLATNSATNALLAGFALGGCALALAGATGGKKGTLDGLNIGIEIAKRRQEFMSSLPAKHQVDQTMAEVQKVIYEQGLKALYEKMEKGEMPLMNVVLQVQGLVNPNDHPFAPKPDRRHFH